MAHYLPPALMAFFRPRPPLEYKPPLEKRKMKPYEGVAAYLYAFNNPVPELPKTFTPAEIRAKRRKKHQERVEKRLKVQESKWDPKAPAEAPKATDDAYKTIFVSRLAFDLTEEDIKKEFEYYGPVRKVRLIRDKSGKSRGYAFVEFESSKDFKEAVTDANNRKIHNRRIVVDVERGRTVKGWKPRRLGGGLGVTRLVGKPASTDGRDGANGDYRDRRRSRSPRRDDRDGRGSRDYRGRSPMRRSPSRSPPRNRRSRSPPRYRGRSASPRRRR